MKVVRSTVAVLAAIGGLAAPPAASQSISQIGQYDSNWGAAFGPIAITTDGEWIAYTRGNGIGTCLYPYEFALVRSDGTDARVVIPGSRLAALYPTSQGSFPWGMSLTADASLLYWWWPDHFAGAQCSPITPQHWYRTNTESGETTELVFDGLPVANFSHSDDGQVLAFKGWDTVSNTYLYYRSGPDLSNATPFLDPAPWVATAGIVSADGMKFAFFGYHGFAPFPADVYVVDLATQGLVTVSPTPVNGVMSVSISADGGEVAYSANNQAPIYGVSGDGSGHHVVSPLSAATSATVTKDGTSVVYRAVDPISGVSKIHRTAWDGSRTVLVEGWNFSAQSMKPMPANIDGSVLPILTPLPKNGAMAVWFDNTPVLTTYGYGMPGTTIHWDIGGETGGSFVLAYAFGPASMPIGAKGTLLLDPSSFALLAAGGISSAYNIGSVSVPLPASLLVPEPVKVHFQALVLDAAGQNGRFTNSTIFKIGDPNQAALWGGPGKAGLPVEAFIGDATRIAEGDGDGAVEEAMRHCALVDPNFALLLERAGWR